MNDSIVTIFGGSGFIGRQVVYALAKEGYRIKVASRSAEDSMPLKTAGAVGQIIPISCDVLKPELVRQAVTNSHIVINLVGILYPKGRQTFQAMHVQAPEYITKAAKDAGVKRLIHMSSLGADRAKTSKYAVTKLFGEQKVKTIFPDVTILRPSVVFGENDNFFNLFARMAKISPFLPLIGGGRTLFQPVFVGDIASAIVEILKDDGSKKRIYELAGPDTLSFKEILQFILKHIDRKRILLPIPFWLAKLKAFFLEILPNPPLTRDQVELLKYDNVVTPKSLGFSDLGIAPKSINEIVPGYLANYK